jgi:hypothetical protein
LASLSKEAENRQPLLNWMRLHRALVALLGRKPSESEGALAEIENGGLYSTTSADAPLVKFFLETAKALRGNVPVPAVEAKVGDADSFKAFALLLFGLKDFKSRRICGDDFRRNRIAIYGDQARFVFASQRNDALRPN